MKMRSVPSLGQSRASSRGNTREASVTYRYWTLRARRRPSVLIAETTGRIRMKATMCEITASLEQWLQQKNAWFRSRIRRNQEEFLWGSRLLKPCLTLIARKCGYQIGIRSLVVHTPTYVDYMPNMT